MKTIKEIKEHIKEIQENKLTVEGLANKYPFKYINFLEDLIKSIKIFEKTNELDALEKMFQDIIVKYDENFSKEDWVFLRTKTEIDEEKDYQLALKFIIGVN